ncbi:MAG: hypothetical protein UY35_C0003G0040 [Candidatus Saccharibacteria bacterium GW2011_GWC2_48_9]|nr:MAG: hypothetical protein UY35_C0003G0040 [Candidatus Saccharibacteria bacterium GW2011_GWC2_48_9]HCH34130.1 hypothetical protein [Candidatus Saccharibacteria bacterium]
MTVSNLTEEAIEIRPTTNDFIAGDENGTPALILDENEFAPTHSLKRFMAPLENVTIPAGEAAKVEVLIEVPADAQAGGYFGAVRFAPAGTEDGSQVNLNASVASLILLTVPGDIVEKLQLTDFNITQDGTTKPFYYDGKDMIAGVRFENTGNLQLAPFGKVSVLRGNDVVYDVDFNDKEIKDMILPDSARKWDVPLKGIDRFGKYTVMSTFTYGTQNQTIEVSKTFWVIPMSFILAAIAGVLLVVGIIALVVWLVMRKRKNHQARKSHTRGVGR